MLAALRMLGLCCKLNIILKAFYQGCEGGFRFFRGWVRPGQCWVTPCIPPRGSNAQQKDGKEAPSECTAQQKHIGPGYANFGPIQHFALS